MTETILLASAAGVALYALACLIRFRLGKPLGRELRHHRSPTPIEVLKLRRADGSWLRALDRLAEGFGQLGPLAHLAGAHLAMAHDRANAQLAAAADAARRALAGERALAPLPYEPDPPTYPLRAVIDQHAPPGYIFAEPEEPFDGAPLRLGLVDELTRWNHPTDPHAQPEQDTNP